MKKYTVILEKKDGKLYAQHEGYNSQISIRHSKADKNGHSVCQIANHNVGIGHSGHPNIDATGSVRGMKKLGYWRKDAQTHRAFGCIYNMSEVSIGGDSLGALAYALETGKVLIANPDTMPEGEVITYTFEV